MLLSKAALQQACMLLAAGGLGAGTMVTVQRVHQAPRERPALTSGAGANQSARPARHVVNASRLQPLGRDDQECVVRDEPAPAPTIARADESRSQPASTTPATTTTSVESTAIPVAAPQGAGKA